LLQPLQQKLQQPVALTSAFYIHPPTVPYRLFKGTKDRDPLSFRLPSVIDTTLLSVSDDADEDVVNITTNQDAGDEIYVNKM